jgi:cell division protein ZapA
VVYKSGGHDMSVKTSAEVVIGGKVYTLSGYEGEDYLQRVAAYINNKLNEFEGIENYKHIHPSMKETLIQLNLADDYFKAKSQIEKLEKEIESKDKEIYDLKHDLISNQVKTESAEEALKKVREENRELLLNKARLESALEEKLLDTDKEKQKEKATAASRKK